MKMPTGRDGQPPGFRCRIARQVRAVSEVVRPGFLVAVLSSTKHLELPHTASSAEGQPLWVTRRSGPVMAARPHSHLRVIFGPGPEGKEDSGCCSCVVTPPSHQNQESGDRHVHRRHWVLWYCFSQLKNPSVSLGHEEPGFHRPCPWAQRQGNA